MRDQYRWCSSQARSAALATGGTRSWRRRQLQPERLGYERDLCAERRKRSRPAGSRPRSPPAFPAAPRPAVSDQVRITLNPAATADAGADRSVARPVRRCSPPAQFGGGAASGLWSGESGSFQPRCQLAHSPRTSPSAAEIAAGGVTLTFTSNDPAGPCVAASDQMRITIDRAATAHARAPIRPCVPAVPRCSLQAASAAVPRAGRESGGSGSFSPGASSPNAVYTPSAAEIAALARVTPHVSPAMNPAGPCGAVSDQMVVTISPAATVNAGADRIVCTTSPQVQLAGGFGGGAASGSWRRRRAGRTAPTPARPPPRTRRARPRSPPAR